MPLKGIMISVGTGDDRKLLWNSEACALPPLVHLYWGLLAIGPCHQVTLSLGLQSLLQ